MLGRIIAKIKALFAGKEAPPAVAPRKDVQSPTPVPQARVQATKPAAPVAATPAPKDAKQQAATVAPVQSPAEAPQVDAVPVYRVEVRSRAQVGDPHAASVAHQIAELGIDTVQSVNFARLFFLIGEVSSADVARVADQLLADRVIEVARVGTSDAGDAALVEVHLKAGVMDPVAASTEKAIRDMGLKIEAVRTARRYELAGPVSEAQRQAIARSLLANAVIEDVHFKAFTPPAVHGHRYTLEIVTVPIRDLDDVALEKLSREGHLFLNLTEMKAIQDHYRQAAREPSDVELEMIAQTWSEHCVHKTFRSDVELKDASGVTIEKITNLIKSTIFGATKELNKPWCISVFEDNAGVIEFDEEHAVCFKVETHNHPSAIEPYGGASTGIGGVLRDPMGTGLGSRPVANTDIFCFGPPDLPASDLPKGVLHPRRVMRGVVGGVRDYGNRMGVPTVNGAVYFDKRYMGNPLVFCGTVGLMPRSMGNKRRPAPGDAIVCVGGRTGRDGIHGATFSSGELTHSHETEFSHAVQIGNAITEKKMLDTILQARDAGLFTAITDCGAGGLSSAVGEMGAELGAEVHLDRVPLKYAGLSYSEIWISEAQERMVLSVPQEKVAAILKVFADEDVEATVIGHFGTDDRTLRLQYQGQTVGEMEMDFLHEGCPRPTKPAVWEQVSRPSPAPPARANYTQVLKDILASPNVASKEWIIRQYDHEVQGGSAVKPLVGVGEDGPGDASVIRPVLSSRKGVALSCGMNPCLGDLDPYASALHAVDEALRNIVCVGGNLDRTAILDNFCWGNCNKPDRMGSFVMAAKACRDAALTYGTPFVSGKDSLNNEFQTDQGQTIAIPPTLLISAISVIDDVGRCVTSDAKAAGNYLFLLGRTGESLGGSHLLMTLGLTSGSDVPQVDMHANLAVMRALQKAIEAGVVASCHDLSEGGLAVAAAELAFSGGLGVDLDLAAVPPAAATTPSTAAKLFAEDAGRFLVEVAPQKYDAFLRLVKDCPVGEVGRVSDTARLIIKGAAGPVVDLTIADAKAAWQGTFKW
ncbi:MAG: phosphoribosylformylglycinamidine synthase subunit PurL [Planctomycetaceae bacterium]|nr:phosphoribosylformylglycinamidine synthase subunit PurL [Planctomycetaceae bacterium]